MDDGVLPFLCVENPAGNRKIILTLQQVKPLKRELNFFSKTQLFHSAVTFSIN